MIWGWMMILRISTFSMKVVLTRKKMTSNGHLSGTRRFGAFPITDFQKTKRQMLTWATSHHSDAGVGIFCFLDNHGYPAGISPGFECLLAAGATDSVEAHTGQAFSRLKEWALDRGEWLFGHFAYDLAAETEPQSAEPPQKPDPVGFPDLFFFIPEVLIELGPLGIRIGSFGDDQEAVLRQILATPIPASGSPDPASDQPGMGPNPSDTRSIPPFVPRFSPAEYRERVAALQRHILRGDCYEVNFCQEFFSQPADLDPLTGWWSLSEASPNPFSCFYRLNGHYLLCASPERYLKKTGSQVFTQPIKGTSARYPDRPAADSASARDLYHSAKDRSENVMVVDLVRNDLSKICLPGSVRVEELYGIYPFPQVFQMISTVTGTLLPDLHWTDAIRETFPMGSMTGAPKHRVVALIDKYERSRRGIFSGAVGYVTPEGNFDFNVVIRSLLYNRADRYLSYQVGSGITFYSDPQAEYEECLIKATGILKALGDP
jgi:para-aminobenzoate synthetase component 1